MCDSQNLYQIAPLSVDNKKWKTLKKIPPSALNVLWRKAWRLSDLLDGVIQLGDECGGSDTTTDTIPLSRCPCLSDCLRVKLDSRLAH